MRPLASIEIKQFAEEPFAFFLVMRMAVTVAMATVLLVVAGILLHIARIGLAVARVRGPVLRRRGGRCGADGTLDDLVEFAPVKPDATAIRAVIDFNSLAFTHDEADVFTDWAVHAISPWKMGLSGW